MSKVESLCALYLILCILINNAKGLNLELQKGHYSLIKLSSLFIFLLSQALAVGVVVSIPNFLGPLTH